MLFRMVLVLNFITAYSLHPSPQDKGHRAGEHNWALNNPVLHPVSSEPPFPNIISRELYYRMAKTKRVLSTFT